MVTTLTEQWPLVALVLAIVLGAGKVIQSQYEERLRELREDLKFWRDLALNGTSLAERLTDVAERTTRKQP